MQPKKQTNMGSLRKCDKAIKEVYKLNVIESSIYIPVEYQKI